MTEVCQEELQTVCTMRPSTAPKSKRLAVLVAGLTERFYPISTLRHVVRPAARAGYEVDYYALLTGSFPEGGFSAYWYKPVRNPWIANLSKADLETFMVREGRRYGARRVAVFHQPNVALDEIPKDPSWPRLFRHKKRDHERLIRNLLWLQALETVYNWSAASEIRGSYNHIILVRNDLHWVDDLHMVHFSDPWTVYSRNVGALCQRSENPMHPDDRALVLGGHVAGTILRAYTAYFHDLSPELDPASSNEDFLITLAGLRDVKWQLVRKDWFPFFAALHMTQADWPEARKCLRGISRYTLEHPTSECVHPSQVILPFCEDFPLQ